jgi:diguanylate cyclase (GGDEF)-like protein
MRAAVDEGAWSDLGRSVLFIDLDHFKAVNDTFGHATGDAVLVGVSKRLSENLRQEDLAMRLGGDEFVVLLGPNVSGSTAANIAARIVAALARPFVIDDIGTAVTIGASVGLATSNIGLTPEALLDAADGAAYAAKNAGRGCVVEAR